jgi:hypothetical protein
VINSVVTDAAGVMTVDWSLDSSAGDHFRIEFLASDSCNGAGNAEGKFFLGETTVLVSATSKASGSNQMTNSAAAGQHVVVTATLLTAASVADATSEFSTCVTVP